MLQRTRYLLIKFNELKTIKKQVINIEKVLQNFRSNFDKFSVKLIPINFLTLLKNILFQNISRKIELIDLEDEQSWLIIFSLITIIITWKKMFRKFMILL